MRIVMAACMLALAGCVFVDAARDQRRLAQVCVIKGTVQAARAEEATLVVVLVRRNEDGATTAEQIVDHFALERAGRWAFVVQAGTYAVAAFEDVSRDLVFQPGEPFLLPGRDDAIVCAPGARIADISLAIPAVSEARLDMTLDIAKLKARNLEGQAAVTLGQLTVAGEVVSLSDARFDRNNAQRGLWQPVDFVVDSLAGIYFLEPFDAGKMPVLFIHGISGTPADFEYLIDRLDRKRFQPWLYFYPSGVHLRSIDNHLNTTMARLQQRHDFGRFAVVAHSMGGLVARGFVLRHADTATADRNPLLITVATPWGGHSAADLGVRKAPVVVQVWRDMAPGSEYQRALFERPMPGSLRHHLLFAFRRNSSSFGQSDDQVVTVASQLAAAAQAEAARVYGFDDTHVGVLRNADVAALLSELLAESVSGNLARAPR